MQLNWKLEIFSVIDKSTAAIPKMSLSMQYFDDITSHHFGLYRTLFHCMLGVYPKIDIKFIAIISTHCIWQKEVTYIGSLNVVEQFNKKL